MKRILVEFPLKVSISNLREDPLHQVYDENRQEWVTVIADELADKEPTVWLEWHPAPDQIQLGGDMTLRWGRDDEGDRV